MAFLDSLFGGDSGFSLQPGQLPGGIPQLPHLQRPTGTVGNGIPGFPGHPPTTPPTNTTGGTSSTTPAPPPPGFTPQQWARLTLLSQKNPQIADLMKQYQGTGGTDPNASWRRVMPTDTSQLLKQLSYNTGEMGMPGGYVGAIQLPAYGETQPPVNNPDMSKYGQAPGLGEATFYRQSINGGMAPIAAMSPLGVPQGWNPGGTGTGTDVKSQLDKYLKGLGNGGGGGGGGGMGGGGPQASLQKSFSDWVHGSLENGGFNGVFAGFPDWGKGKGAGAGGGKKPKTGGPGPTTGGTGTGTGGATRPGRGVPISLPFGF